MVLDVAPLLRGEVKKIDIDYMLSPEQIDSVSFDDAHVVGVLTDNSGYMRLKLQATLSYHGKCARCLAPVDGVFSLDFERTVTTEGMIDEERLEELEDEYVVIDGHELSVDDTLCEELILSFPFRLLCSEDCEGLCPKCGKPRSEGDCGCPTREINPQFAALAGLFDNDEEEDKK